jgi:hypothetical protein
MRIYSRYGFALALFFLLNGTGVFAMIHCQGQQHEAGSTSSNANIYYEFSSKTKPQKYVTEADKSSGHCLSSYNNYAVTDECDVCEECCSIHYTPIHGLIDLLQTHSHDKIMQFAALPANGIGLQQERPPKVSLIS